MKPKTLNLKSMIILIIVLVCILFGNLLIIILYNCVFIIVGFSMLAIMAVGIDSYLWLCGGFRFRFFWRVFRWFIIGSPLFLLRRIFLDIYNRIKNSNWWSCGGHLLPISLVRGIHLFLSRLHHLWIRISIHLRVSILWLSLLIVLLVCLCSVGIHVLVGRLTVLRILLSVRMWFVTATLLARVY
jgi:hypothetical protein